MNAELVAIITEELTAHHPADYDSWWECECGQSFDGPEGGIAHQAERIAARLGIELPHDPFDAMFNPPLFRVRALEQREETGALGR